MLTICLAIALRIMAKTGYVAENAGSIFAIAVLADALFLLTLPIFIWG